MAPTRLRRRRPRITASTTDDRAASLSLEKSFNNLERRYVPTVRAQQDYARVQEKVNDAVTQNPALQERANVILQNAAQQYQAASRGLTGYGKALNQSTSRGRLARHELINLSRQIQDVGVGIVSGQSPFTILVQQGAQIADVFASIDAERLSRVLQPGGVLARGGSMASTAGMTTGCRGGGRRRSSLPPRAMPLGSATSSGRLSGIGRASGVTRDQINADRGDSVPVGVRAVGIGGAQRRRRSPRPGAVYQAERRGSDQMRRRLCARAVATPAEVTKHARRAIGMILLPARWR